MANPPYYIKRSSSTGHGSGMSSFEEFRYNCVTLPQAGMTTLRAHKEDLTERLRKKITHRAPPDLSLLYDTSAFGPQKPDEFGMKSRIDPKTRPQPAGQNSNRVHCSIAQNLYDKHEMVKEAQTSAKAMTNARVAHRRDHPNRTEEHTQPMLQHMVEHPAHADKRLRAQAVFGEKSRTDPITHFADEDIQFDPLAWWKPCRRHGYEHDKRRHHTWTWQKHRRGGQHSEEEDEDTKKASGHKDVGTIVSCRGSRTFNMFGQEDMHPAATRRHLKCELTPSKFHIKENDRRLLPQTHRQEPFVHEQPHYLESDEIHGCLDWPTESSRRPLRRPRSARAVLEPYQRHAAGTPTRPLRPAPPYAEGIDASAASREHSRDPGGRLAASRERSRDAANKFSASREISREPMVKAIASREMSSEPLIRPREAESFPERNSAEGQARAILDAISALADTCKGASRVPQSKSKQTRPRTPPPNRNGSRSFRRPSSARSLPSSPSQTSMSDFKSAWR